VEPGFDKAVIEGLRLRGHELVEVPKVAGGMNGVLVDEGGSCTARHAGGLTGRRWGSRVGMPTRRP